MGLLVNSLECKQYFLPSTCLLSGLVWTRCAHIRPCTHAHPGASVTLVSPPLSHPSDISAGSGPEHHCSHAFPLLRSNAIILRFPFELQPLADVIINIISITLVSPGEFLAITLGIPSKPHRSQFTGREKRQAQELCM